MQMGESQRGLKKLAGASRGASKYGCGVSVIVKEMVPQEDYSREMYRTYFEDPVFAEWSRWISGFGWLRLRLHASQRYYRDRDVVYGGERQISFGSAHIIVESLVANRVIAVHQYLERYWVREKCLLLATRHFLVCCLVW